MATRLEIWNLALFRVGEQLGVSDPSERSVPAIQCRTVYPIARRSVLQSFHWRFAKRRTAAVAVTTVTIEPFEFVYQHPADALSIISLFNFDPRIESIAREQTYPPLGSYVPSYGDLRGLGRTGVGRTEWEVHGHTAADGSNQKYLCSYIEAEQVEYMKDLEDETQFEPLFADALSWRMAVDLARGRPESRRLSEEARFMFADTIRQAEAETERQAQYADREPSLATARY